MYENSAFGRDYNNGMVDRGLGKAYELVKEVHSALPQINSIAAITEDNKKVITVVDDLAKELARLNPKEGLFLSHDLGEVGVKEKDANYNGKSFLSALTKSYGSIETVGKNIDALNTLFSHINELKAIAATLKEITNILNIKKELASVNANARNIELVASFVSEISSVSGYTEQIKQLADDPETLKNLAGAYDTLDTLIKHIEAITICAANTRTYLEVNSKLKQSQEILERVTFSDYGEWFPLFGKTPEARSKGKRFNIPSDKLIYSWTCADNCWVMVDGTVTADSTLNGELRIAINYGFEVPIYERVIKPEEVKKVHQIQFMPRGATLQVTHTNCTPLLTHLAVYKDFISKPDTETAVEEQA